MLGELVASKCQDAGVIRQGLVKHYKAYTGPVTSKDAWEALIQSMEESCLNPL